MTAVPAALEEVYISVDVEAAGPIPATYSLLSLGASVVSDPTQHFYAEFQPINDNVVPEAMAVSGFSLMAYRSLKFGVKSKMALSFGDA